MKGNERVAQRVKAIFMQPIGSGFKEGKNLDAS
jgi:hypothetical protein